MFQQKVKVVSKDVEESSEISVEFDSVGMNIAKFAPEGISNTMTFTREEARMIYQMIVVAYSTYPESTLHM